MKSNKEFLLKASNFLILVFLVVRLALNIQPYFLPIFFASSYGLLFALFLKKSSLFLPIFVVFLSIDGMIGTYLFSNADNLGFEYFGTMVVNVLIAIISIMQDRLRINS